jgi:hypothetical protein
MKQLNDIVDYYLKNDSNYAIMITGEWGIGKTFYFKKTLAKQITSTPTFKNAAKNYKPIIISLFGLSTIEEIQTEIFLSIYPLLKNKTVKLGASIGKSLVKGILKLKGLEEYGEILSETETNRNDWINFNEIVLCFDDFERLSNNLSIEELVGFINSLVENESIKVIILANEDKISKENYHALKEKVVGNSIEFIQDLNSAYDGLINDKFSSFPEYHKFLKFHKPFILDIFTRGSINLRILGFILDYFHTIFSSYITIRSKNDILEKYDAEVFPKLLKFSISVGCLYKLGVISFKRRENLEEFGFFDLDDLLFDGRGTKKTKTEEEKSVREKFIEKYYKDDIYNFFPSIYDFITGGSIFDAQDLISELKSHFHIQENTIPPAYDIFNKLSYPAVFTLKDVEYNALTRQMLAYSDQGKYEPQSSLTIFYFASRFENPLNLNLEKLEKRISKGLNKGSANFSYVASLDFHLNIEDLSSNKIHLENIKKVALEINESLIQEITNEKYREIEELYKTNVDEFTLKLIDKNEHYIHEPVFENFSVRNFYSFFINSSGDIKWKIVSLFRHRYPEYVYSGLQPEIKFIEELGKKIERKIQTLPSKGITSFVYKEFLKTLNQSVDRLKR